MSNLRGFLHCADNENPRMIHEISGEAAKSAGSLGLDRQVGKSIDLYWLSDPTREEINQGIGEGGGGRGKN